MLLAIIAGKPLYLLPQSFWTILASTGKIVYSLFVYARLVMVREKVSAEYLSSCGIPEKRFAVLPDMAFAFQASTRPAACEWYVGQGIRAGIDGPLLGLTIMDWGAQSSDYPGQVSYETIMASAIRHFIKTTEKQSSSLSVGDRSPKKMTEYPELVLSPNWRSMLIT